MADPTVRALQLLDLLQSAPQRAVAELADRLGVDERTVRRDVRRLTGAGVQVESVRGRYGGYRLAAGARVLPISFTGEETVAVLLGLARARRMPGEPGLPARTAAAKIRRAMRPQDAARTDAALRALPETGPGAGGDSDSAVLLTLAEAVDSRRPVDLRYDGRSGPSRRVIHPFTLVARSGRWYLLAGDAGTGQERAFRLDRVRTARALSGTFPAPDLDDAAARLAEHFATAEYRWTVVLHLRATTQHLRAHLPASVARLSPLDPVADAFAPEPSPPGPPVPAEPGPSWHRAEIRAEHLDWIPATLAALDCPVRVEGPPELRELVRVTGQRLLDAAEDQPS